MKKMLLLVVVVFAIMMLSAVAVSADPPPGVDAAHSFINQNHSCGHSHNGAFYLGPTTKYHYSNGATGHFTWKCKSELVSGPPQYMYFETLDVPYLGCEGHVSLEGNKGMWTGQCFGQWYP